MDALLHDVAQLTAPRWRDGAQIERRPITLQVEAAAGMVVDGWTAALREALTNLVFNAVDALPDGGTIGLTARHLDDNQVCIEVVDSGTGMDAQTRARVFEPFFTTKGARGSGLGLSQVFGIVERHRGRIEVDSAIGRGTTVRLLLPAASDASAAVPSAPNASVASARRLRILTVDDEPLICKMMKRTLRAGRHYVVTATSGEEAVEVLSSDTFDLVISDVGLGSGMNGWDLAERIRRDWPNLSVILATGWGAQIDPTEARQKGVVAVLAKPYRPEDLEAVLAQIAPAADVDQAA